jgi:hypothetical protein
MLKRGGQFDNSIFVGVAKALAEHIQNPTPEYILPNMFDREVVDIVYNYVLGH